MMRLALTAPAWIGLFTVLCPTVVTAAEPQTITIAASSPAQTNGFNMGTARRPDGSTITLDNYGLRLNGGPWTPVMGEFHYARYPENEWREELLKMKAGGIGILATYVFWIHHEEIEGEFDWSSRRSLRRFIETANEVGLKVIVRCGPWCHGEVRNGGLPDWILKKGWRTRSDDTNYLAKVQILYGQIAGQLEGLLWKDGGPVIGIQLENEFGGPAEHLLSLKRIAREVGLDVPIYTRTGWPALRTSMPFGEIVPLYGVYAEGFWDRELTSMPGRYWSGFHFSLLRADANIANELLGRRDARDASDVARYPYLTCEIGGGMMNSYHRRILVDPVDIESTTLVKLGSGSTSPGYYMYHGGVNPEGKLTTLMESQATEFWNDMPVKNYDFQAPLGEYGQIRPQYHSLRRLHSFLWDNGSDLAVMPTVLPDQRPGGRDDVATLRWAVRSDGHSGFVFVNNHERGKMLPPKRGVQFVLSLADNTKLTFPTQPVDVASDVVFCWPFNHRFQEFTLAYATAMQFGHILEEDRNTRTLFFAATPGVPAEFAFATDGIAKIDSPTPQTRDGERIILRNVPSGRGVFARITTKTGKIIQCVLLDDADSLAFWKGAFGGRNRVVLTRAGAVFDGDQLRVTANTPDATTIAIFPAPTNVVLRGAALKGEADGIFQRYALRGIEPTTTSVGFEQIQPAGPLREIPLGKIRQPVAAAPEDADFEKAAVWRIKLPAKLDVDADPVLRLHYVGDVARLMLNGKLITDDFYNGNAWEIGLRRHAPEILNGDLRIAILPLRKDAPIFMAKEARPDFGNGESAVVLRSVEIVPRHQVQLSAK